MTRFWGNYRWPVLGLISLVSALAFLVIRAPWHAVLGAGAAVFLISFEDILGILEDR